MQVMIDDGAPTYTREGNLLKTYNNVLPRKRTVVSEVSKETYSKKCDKNREEKTAIYVIIPQIKGGRRERERNRHMNLI